MNNQVLLLMIAAPVLLSGVVFWWVLRADRRRQFVQRRLAAITVGSSGSTPQLSLVRDPSPTAVFQLPGKFGARFDAAFEATGNRVGLPHLLIAAIIAAIIVIAFTGRILALSPMMVVLLGGAAAGVAPILLLRFTQVRYRNKFLNVFPDALDLVGRGVRAGLPVNEALAVAGREIADPVGSELRRVVEEVRIGIQMVDALQQMADRVRVPDFRFLVVTLSVQQKTGGSLAETLANLSRVIRARKALRLKARALSAEAKASASVLAVLPFVVGGLMAVTNHDLAKMLWVDPTGRFMLGVAFISLVLGLTTMGVMIKRAVR